MADAGLVATGAVPPADLVQDYQRAAINPRTARAYASDWTQWEQWAVASDHQVLPATPDAVAAYAAELAQRGRAVASIRRALAVISRSHATEGHASPTSSPQVRSTMRGIAKVHGSHQRQAAPFLVEHVRTAVHHIMQGSGPWRLRDRAVILVGWACGLRSAELCGLAVQDLEDNGDQVVLQVRRSKTDQDGKGRAIRLPNGSGLTDPVSALREWRAARAQLLGVVAALADVDGKSRTALWLAQPRGAHHLGEAMATDAVTRMVKEAAAAQGLNPASYSSHSLRRGLVTTMLAAGRSVVQVQAVTGHRSVASVSRYAEAARLLEASPVEGLGL